MAHAVEASKGHIIRLGGVQYAPMAHKTRCVLVDIFAAIGNGCVAEATGAALLPLVDLGPLCWMENMASAAYARAEAYGDSETSDACLYTRGNEDVIIRFEIMETSDWVAAMRAATRDSDSWGWLPLQKCIV